MAKYLKWVFAGVGVLIAVLAIILITRNGVPTLGTWTDCDRLCQSKGGKVSRFSGGSCECIDLPEPDPMPDSPS